MGLVEFLRQWQRGRLAAGIALSVLVHALLVLALWRGPSAFPKMIPKRGEPLIVELPEGRDSPPPGMPGGPPPSPPPARTPAPPAAPKAAPPAPAPRAVAKATPPPAPRTPDPPARPTPAPEPPRPAPARAPEPLGTEPTPIAKAPEPPTVAKAPEPAPVAKAPEPPTPAESHAAPPSSETASQPSAQRQVAAVPPAPSGPRGGAAVPDIRALGRGTGGAGGMSKGRSGISGEPIPLESDDPRYSAYLEQLRRMLQAKMTWPCDNYSRKRGDCLDRDEELLVEFGIFKSGDLAFIEVRQPSRQPVYDESSENVIKLASPFPPPPPMMLAAMKAGSTGVPILVHFRYSQTVSYRMLLVP